ncbi:hypothetical protein pipiens_020504, partial [Culex pipiens pipiens]
MFLTVGAVHDRIKWSYTGDCSKSNPCGMTQLTCCRIFRCPDYG